MTGYAGTEACIGNRGKLLSNIYHVDFLKHRSFLTSIHTACQGMLGSAGTESCIGTGGKFLNNTMLILPKHRSFLTSIHTACQGMHGSAEAGSCIGERGKLVTAQCVALPNLCSLLNIVNRHLSQHVNSCMGMDRLGLAHVLVLTRVCFSKD
jgi:hypothetical protein